LVPQNYSTLYQILYYNNVNGCKQLSRTVSARIPTELHEELRERCNLIGESINDFVKASIELMLRGSVDFDFGNELLDKLEDERKAKVIRLGSNNAR
jgi:predicted DNA-binding protein